MQVVQAFVTVLFLIFFAFLYLHVHLFFRGKMWGFYIEDDPQRGKKGLVRAGLAQYRDRYRERVLHPYVITFSDREFIAYLIDKEDHAVRDSEGIVLCSYNAPEDDEESVAITTPVSKKVH